MSESGQLTVASITETRAALSDVLRRFRAHGALASPVVFGANRRPEGAIIPFELYAQLVPVLEDLEVARIVRDRGTETASIPFSDLAERLGLDASSYR